MKLYLTRNGKYDAVDDYDLGTGVFTVLKGSIVSDSISNAPTFRGAKSIATARSFYVKNQKVLQDVVFKSSSTTGNFVTGNSTDGPSSWREETGKKLKEILSELKR